ncbi:hypothetical protein, conserved [Eimeria tenella]|uniref:Uncharacterized protein n=1 Tax=Eimeria tenella TaxID=5802 RepID=U6L0S3_EIMTE|nr:hypothetical protein, conserved [Eimeria tenella]CDJ42189.1 hypothetical protein, conserved [Eimeria tenella]|eukprot:XP_013232939.1 hypothetical protein, conserved [Eimeria tenella]
MPLREPNNMANNRCSKMNTPLLANVARSIITVTKSGMLLNSGKFCPEGTASPDDATECTAGHMCPEGSASPMLCPQGTKQPSTGQANCIKCTVGTINTSALGTLAAAGEKLRQGKIRTVSMALIV